MPITKGMIGPIDKRFGQPLTFQFNPSEIKRSRVAAYARNNAAKADFPNSRSGSAPALEWLRNEAEEITFDLLFYDTEESVDDQLKRLDDMLKKDQNLGEPPRLFFQFGNRADEVRVTNKTVIEKMWSEDLMVEHAVVSLTLSAPRSRIAKR